MTTPPPTRRTDWSLRDAQEQALLTPKTFEAPKPSELEGLKVGDYVKLCFCFAQGGTERMWVQIALCPATGELRGKLSNYSEKALESRLIYGQNIAFTRRHVYQSMRPGEG